MGGKILKNDPNVLDREVQALELRRAGLSYRQIAVEVGWANESSAYRAVERAMNRVLQEPADKVRRLECERLDDWLSKLYPAIDRGEARSIEVGLKVLERRAKLLGLDSPVRIEAQVDVFDGSAIEQEVSKLAAMLETKSAEIIDVDELEI